MAGGYRNWRLETDGDGIVWLSFDKADSSANILSAEVMSELDRILDELGGAKPRGLIIRSAKESGFIAGADVEEFTRIKDADDAMRLVRRGWDLYNKLASLPFPTLALVNGFCMGGGVELSLAGRSVDARRAKSIGLVDATVPPRIQENSARMMVLEAPRPRTLPFVLRLMNSALMRPLVVSMARKQLAARASPDHYPAPYAILE